MDKNFRPAVSEDIPLIQTLAEICFRDTYQEILSRSQLDYMMRMMYSTEALEACIGGNQPFFIVQLQDKPCGYFSIETVSKKEYKLQKIYLLPNIQKQGLGRYVIEKSLEYVHNQGGENSILRLNVNRENSAADFYLRMGFKVEHSGNFEIGNGYYMNDYVMRIDI